MKNNLSTELFDFIEKGRTSYHVTAEISKKLIEAGYKKLEEGTPWKLCENEKYFVTRNGSSLIAFRVPSKEYHGYQIVASHGDTPTFKLKEIAELESEGHYTKLNVEKYGGGIYSTWFDRPLSIAGRVMVRRENRISSELVDINKDLVLIPNLAIHMNSELNNGYKYNLQTDFMPVFSDELGKDGIKILIGKTIGVSESEIVGHDLFLYNRQKGSIWGANKEFISSQKLDDLQCVFASLKGFLNSNNLENAAVYAVFDNEEVGSSTKQGAASTFLHDVLERINDNFKRTREQFHMSFAKSFMLSADNVHAVHPNHPEKADPVNRPYLNGGIVIKYNASQKYTTDSVSSAILRTICDNVGVPVQVYANRSDIAGGSTLGSIANTKVSIPTVDVGLAQLAMHSAYESAGALDTEYFVKMTTAFYNTAIQRQSDDQWSLY